MSDQYDVKEKLLKPYWVHSSSNALISKLLQISNPETKMILEDILNGGCLKTEIDEEIIFDQLEKKRGAIWSLLLASAKNDSNNCDRKVSFA